MHAARGTYRADRHGPLPDGVTPVVLRPAFSAVPRGTLTPAVDLAQPITTLVEEDCPAVLTPEGRVFWLRLIVDRPTERVFAQVLATYVQGWETWQRAVRQIQTIGDLVKQGNRPVPNPLHTIRKDAEKTMLDSARFLGWQSGAAAADRGAAPAAPVTRLQAFLDSRGGA